MSSARVLDRPAPYCVAAACTAVETQASATYVHDDDGETVVGRAPHTAPWGEHGSAKDALWEKLVTKFEPFAAKLFKMLNAPKAQDLLAIQKKVEVAQKKLKVRRNFEHINTYLL